jgi:hypothetical protein
MSNLSRIGLKVAQEGLFGGEARKFYYEVRASTYWVRGEGVTPPREAGAQAATRACSRCYRRAMVVTRAPRRAAVQVCRCVPFIQRAMKLEEVVSVRDMRSVVKEQFKKYKDVKDQRVRRSGCRRAAPYV